MSLNATILSKSNILFGVYSLLIILLVTLPINGEDQFLGHLNDIYVVRIRLDYLSHFVLFVPWVFLAFGAFGLTRYKMGFRMVTITGMLLFGLASEAIQYFLPYRTFNINDLVANVIGIHLGILISRLIYRKLSLTQV